MRGLTKTLALVLALSALTACANPSGSGQSEWWVMGVDGSGYRVQCEDGQWSNSGGRPGACSGHGGVREPVPPQPAPERIPAPSRPSSLPVPSGMVAVSGGFAVGWPEGACPTASGPCMPLEVYARIDCFDIVIVEVAILDASLRRLDSVVLPADSQGMARGQSSLIEVGYSNTNGAWHASEVTNVWCGL